MVQYIKVTLCLLAVTTTVRSQYFDIFTALQPFIQRPTTRPQYTDHTTKTRAQQRLTSKPRQDSHSGSFNYDVKNEKTDKITNSAIVFQDETTQRPIRKTTKASSHKNNDYIRNTTNTRFTMKPPSSQRDTDIAESKSKVSQNSKSSYDKEGKVNTAFVYETARPNYSYTMKSLNENHRNEYITTHNPLTNRPGVRPAVAHGPPITNRPATLSPSFGPRPDPISPSSVTPELIIGPNEDFMSAVEKRRYIELGEKMCDRYKASNIRQLEAIPLLPSPDPVRINVSSCASPNIPLVVGGKAVDIHEFPHMALLGWKKTRSEGHSWKCGGSLVSSQFILTAAHCAYQDRDDSVATGPPSLVQLASSYLNDPNGRMVRVAAVIRHPKYKFPKSYYDIAIVKMATSITFSDAMKPACLGVPPPTGDPVIATGWGRTEFGDQSQELRSVSIPVWDMAECYEVLGTSRKLPDGPSRDSQVCAGERKGGKDTCQGDSGGPAQIRDGCVWRVVAVTSLGRSCGAPHTPALYASVPRAFVAAVVFGDTERDGSSNNRTPDQDKQNHQTSNVNSNNQNNREINIEYNSSDKKYSEPNYQPTNMYDNNYQNNINNHNNENRNTNVENNKDKQQSDYNRNDQNNKNNQGAYNYYNTNSNNRQETNQNNYETKRNTQFDEKNRRQTQNTNEKHFSTSTSRYDNNQFNNNNQGNNDKNKNIRNNNDYTTRRNSYPQNVGYNVDVNYAGIYNRQNYRQDAPAYYNSDRPW